MKKVAIVIGNVLLWMIVIFALVVTMLVFSSTNSNGVANFLGYIPLTVESPSMHPTFDEGDLIICKQIEDPYSLKVDDVITFWTLIDGQKVKNTHRIVKINDTGNSISFITRGDNNPIDDELPAYQSELIGKWTNVRLTGAGKIMAFLRTKLGFFVCILLPMALFFLLELYKFILTVISLKNDQNVPELDEEEIRRRAVAEYIEEQKAKELAAQQAQGNANDKPAESADSKKTDEKPAESKGGNADDTSKSDDDNADDDTSESDSNKTDEKSEATAEGDENDKKADEKPAEK